MKFVTHVRYGGIYELNGTNLSSIKKCYHSDDTVTYDRFDYAYCKKDYRKMSKKEFRECKRDIKERWMIKC